jgi:hypothetical protein
MPELTWAEMQKSSPNAHLIVATVPPEGTAVTPGALKLRVELLARLARHLQLRGAYAIAGFPEDDKQGCSVRGAARKRQRLWRKQ